MDGDALRFETLQDALISTRLDFFFANYQHGAEPIE